MNTEMALATAAKEKALAESDARASAVRERQRSAIATPGMRTPAATPRRKFGL
jgi:hypothetical protein